LRSTEAVQTASVFNMNM